jgi:hypothetical protein
MPFEIAADLISLLAYPWASEADLQVRTQRRLCARYLRDLYEADPRRWSEPITVKPGYLLLKEKASKEGASNLEKRLRNRLAAAETLLPFLVAVKRGEDPQIGIAPIALKRSKQRVRENNGRLDARNFRKRVIASSEPVLHIALAWAWLIYERNALGQPNPTHLELMHNGELLVRLLLEAERTSVYLRQWESTVGRLRVTEIRLAQKGVQLAGAPSTPQAAQE